MCRDPPRPTPVGVTVGGNGGDALKETQIAADVSLLWELLMNG
jgi:hypothetical protein